MRIAALKVFLAAVFLAVVFVPALQAKVRNSYERSIRDVYPNDRYSEEKTFEGDSHPGISSFSKMKFNPLHQTVRNRWLSPPESNQLLRNEGGEEKREVQCCPSVEHIVEPQGGINRDNLYVHLYRDGENIQKFYELACRDGIEDKPCRFMDRHFHNISRCVQMYSYTYAIVRETAGDAAHLRHQHHRPDTAGHFPTFSSNSADGWMLDYIKVRSGCSCVLDPKKVDKNKRQKSRLRSGGDKSGRGRKPHHGPSQQQLLPEDEPGDNT